MGDSRLMTKPFSNGDDVNPVAEQLSGDIVAQSLSRTLSKPSFWRRYTKRLVTRRDPMDRSIDGLGKQIRSATSWHRTPELVPLTADHSSQAGRGDVMRWTVRNPVSDFGASVSTTPSRPTVSAVSIAPFHGLHQSGVVHPGHLAPREPTRRRDVGRHASRVHAPASANNARAARGRRRLPPFADSGRAGRGRRVGGHGWHPAVANGSGTDEAHHRMDVADGAGGQRSTGTMSRDNGAAGSRRPCPYGQM